MSQSTLTRKSLLPSWTSDLFDSGRFLSPSFMDFDNDLPSLDYAKRIPSVNVTENEKEFRIEMAAPGLERTDFKVKVENGVLTISSEKEQEKKEEKKNYTRREYSYNSFSRAFTLPENCAPDQINAKYENGILGITLPKKEVTVAKPVKEIKVS